MLQFNLISDGETNKKGISCPVITFRRVQHELVMVYRALLPLGKSIQKMKKEKKN